MVITFYKTTEDFRKLDKTLGTSTGSATGVLHEKANDLRMSIKIPGTLFNVVTASNYAFVDTTQAYYYLDSYDIENDCVIINLNMDVRKTFAAQIKDTTATINRSASEWQGYLYDSGYELLAYKTAAMRNFPTDINDDNMILTTVG